MARLATAAFLLLSALLSGTTHAADRRLRHRHRGNGPPPKDATAAAPVPVEAPAVTPQTAPRGADAPDAFNFTDLRWTSEHGEIRVNDQTFHIKGVAWFGMEDDGATLHGLDKVKMGEVLKFLSIEGFNAIRFSVSLDFALNLGQDIVGYDHLRKLFDEDLWELNRGQLLSKVIDKAGEKGFVVLVDMHRLSLYDQGELWYGNGYSEEDLLKGWDNLLTLLKGKWNVMGLDLKNEPRGMATWGTGDERTDWAMAATRIIKFMLDKHPDYHGLFFVQGVENPTGTWQTSTGRWWGGDLEGINRNAIDLGAADANKRVVYAPHIYGPGEYMMDYFMVSDFPSNLGTVFQAQWGFAESQTGRAVVIGEWGGAVGTNSTPVGQWGEYLVDFLVEHCIADTFFWALNPDSVDTGGLLKLDWASPDDAKLDLLARLQPTPSRLFQPPVSGPVFTFFPGKPTNPRCTQASPSPAA